MNNKYLGCEIVGIENADFIGRDGNQVKGMRLNLTEAIAADRGTGCRVDSVFLTEARLHMLGFTPALGQHVEVLYDRRGKVREIRLLDDVDIVLDK